MTKNRDFLIFDFSVLNHLQQQWVSSVTFWWSHCHRHWPV